jgi:hypothetical protein
MPLPLPLVVATAVMVVGLAGAIVLVGWRAKAIGPGVFYLAAVALLALLAGAIFVAVRR